MPKRKISSKTTAKRTSVTTKSRRADKPSISKGATKTNRTGFWVTAFFILMLGAVILVPRQYITPSSNSILEHIVSYSGKDGQNALTLLKAHHQVGAQQFSIGAFVTSIDSISAPQNYYWAFTVNGKASDVGADSYITKNADILTWQLQRIQ